MSLSGLVGKEIGVETGSRARFRGTIAVPADLVLNLLLGFCIDSSSTSSSSSSPSGSYSSSSCSGVFGASGALAGVSVVACVSPVAGRSNWGDFS